MTNQRPPAMFLADSLGLDFLNSVAVPVDTTVEWLGSGEDLLAWLEQADLLAPQALKEVRASAGPGELDAVAAQARALREWFRGFVKAHQGKPLKAGALAELEPLNRLLARDDEYRQVTVKGRAEIDGDSTGALKLVRRRRLHSSDALLLPIANAMAELLTTANFSYVKHCEGPACTLCFYDTTSRHVRRWCSMAICGNRAKQAAHRDRVAGKRKS